MREKTADKKKIKEHKAALESRVNKLARACDKTKEVEKEQFITVGDKHYYKIINYRK